MLLGKGTFAEVRELSNLQAVKINRESHITPEFVREWMLLATLNHPNIIELLGVDVIDGKPALILNKMKHTLYRNYSSLTYESIRKIMFQLLLALEYLSQRGVVHGDLKSINIMTDPGVRIIDFGLAEIDPDFTGELYTLVYRAPEVMDTRHCSHLTDMWALGCVFYEMLTGTTFINEKQESYKACRDEVAKKLKYRISVPDYVTEDEFDLLNKLLCYEKYRISATEALAHPYFNVVSMPRIICGQRPCALTRISVSIVDLVSRHQLRKKFPDKIWGLSIHLLQQLYVYEITSSEKTMVRHAIDLAGKYHNYEYFAQNDEILDLVLLLGKNVNIDTVWDLVDPDEDLETIYLLKVIERTELSIKPPEEKLALCRSRDSALYEG